MKNCISLTDKYLNDKRKTRVKDAAFEFEESELEKMSIIIGMQHIICEPFYVKQFFYHFLFRRI